VLCITKRDKPKEGNGYASHPCFVSHHDMAMVTCGCRPCWDLWSDGDLKLRGPDVFLVLLLRASEAEKRNMLSEWLINILFLFGTFLMALL
jgi:hypothetical protein